MNLYILIALAIILDFIISIFLTSEWLERKIIYYKWYFTSYLFKERKQLMKDFDRWIDQS